MVEKKIISIKKDKNIILYQIFIDRERLLQFLDVLENRYRKVETDTVDTIFSGIVPLSYGKYDSMKEICTIKDLGIADSKKERQSEEYYKTLGGVSREWSFLSLEEKLKFMPVEGTSKGKVRLEITYPSICAKKIKETLLTDDSKCIIDGTEIIKLYNHIMGLSNCFTFDKTIDLNKKRKKWNDPSRAFLSLDDYQLFLKNSEYSINQDDIEITEREAKNIRENISVITQGLRKCISAEQIGMFPMDIDLSEDLEILKRYAIRNEDFTWFNAIFEYAPINYDGGQILGEYRKKILNNYDLNGINNEKEIIRKINSREDIFKRIEQKNNANKKEILTKKIKAAS